jgi:hypothetical protein
MSDTDRLAALLRECRAERHGPDWGIGFDRFAARWLIERGRKENSCVVCGTALRGNDEPR